MGKKIAENLQLNYYSTGKAFRELAQEYRMSLEEFTQYVEDNPQIDEKLDDKIILIAKKGDVIIESQLSGHLLENIADFKILLSAPLEIRVKRIAERDGVLYEEALKETKLRERSELNRFKKLYQYDLENMEVYDLNIDTSNLTIEEVVQKILEFIRSNHG